MKNAKVFMGVIILILLNSCTQDLTCTDFKEGTFYIPADTLIDKSSTLIRKGNSQVENRDGIEGCHPEHILLEWIDDCSYRAKYDSSKMQLGKKKTEFNENNGIVVEKVDIKGNCMEYIATLTLPDGEEIKQGGIICKE